MPFKIVRDDLTRMQVDVIVNTANPNPVVGSGTDIAVYEAAGIDQLLKDRQKIGVIQRGEAALTKGYALPAKYIIHTVGPVWQGGRYGEEGILRSCYEKSLKLAAKKKCESIAFPLISTGNYGFPRDRALKIVVETVRSFLEQHDMMIYLVVFGSKATKLSESMFDTIESRVDDAYVKEKEVLEYQISHLVYGDPAEANIRLDRRRRSEETELPSWGREYGQPFPDLSEDMCLSEESGFIGSYEPVPDKESAKSLSPKKLAPKKSVLKESALKESAPSLEAPTTSSVQKKSSPRSLAGLLKQKEETFTQMLLRLIKEKGLTNAQAYQKANQDKKLFSKIKNDLYYQPKKKTVMAFALGLELSLDETKDLLARAGFAFSPSSNFDKVIQYCIEVQEYDIYSVEIILYDLGLETLCNY